MGIKDLNPYLRANVSEAIKELELNQFKGKIVCIDTSIYFYKFLYKNNRYLEGFYQQIFRLRKNGLTPIYIFDGAPPQEKMKTLEIRKEKKEETRALIESMIAQKEELSSEEEKKALEFKISMMKKKLIYITSEYITKLKNLLELMNVQYIQAPGEADLICGKLAKQGVVDLVMSDDMDLLTSGSSKVLRNFFITSNRVMYYDLDKILELMDININQWIDFCILCGCDYCDRIPNLGPINALKYIKLYGNVNGILENIGSKYKVPENYREEYALALFNFRNEGIYEFEAIPITRPDDETIKQIITILSENTNLSGKQIMNRINAIY
tara:strand:- start:4560 stop:5537 length:978 start_codon:yes stop_codon:yes gene_type:complete